MKAHAANLQHRGVHGPNRDPKLTRQFVAVDCGCQICRRPGFDLFDNVKALLKGMCAFQVERTCVEKSPVERCSQGGPCRYMDSGGVVGVEAGRSRHQMD